MRRALIILAAFAVSACVHVRVAHFDTAAADEIRAVLEDQVEAWNRGDIPGFMAGYWRSPELRFASGGTVATGWEETLARYQAGYPTPEAMGQLSFTALDIDVIGPDAAVAFGGWRLERAADAPSGLFTLILRRVDGAWRIVHDHTSSAD